MKKKLTALLLALVFVMTSVLAGCGKNEDTEDSGDNTATQAPAGDTGDDDTPEATQAPDTAVADPGTLPRTETLYYGGLQWNPVTGWNPLGDNNNNALTIVQSSGGSRSLIWETLYMYNMLDGKLYPFLADGDYQWNDAMTEMTVKIKAAAKWSDGTPVTAEDVVYTFDTNVKIGNAQGNGFGPYIDKIEAVDASTIKIYAKLNDAGKTLNPLQILTYLGQCYVIPKPYIEAVEARTGGDATAMKADFGEDSYGSGAYKKYYVDDQKIILIRDENYWGQDASMWGKLPVPKYICHNIYADNPASEVAFKAGEIDVNQQFIGDIQNLWLEEGLPISTYMDEAPYGLCANMPTMWFNLAIPGLDNINIRKAIAIAVDYDAINKNAMTGQSPTFQQTPRSLMNPTAGEQALYDHDAVADLQWVGNDVDGANKLLDDAGIVDTDGDGIRELNGTKLSFNVACPFGWTDWQAAVEIVAAVGPKIGIELATEYPEPDPYQKTVVSANQTDYDIFMMWTNSAGPAEPWGRIRNILSSEFNGVDNNWSGNWGHYDNPRVQELLDLIPAELDQAKVKEYYTELVKIYLTDIPSFSLMYRPNLFHAVNESVWTGFPEDGDGKNIPPLILTDGYSIAGLYNLTLVQ
jgi:peptide/nickel transport system substrate-binding protein